VRAGGICIASSACFGRIEPLCNPDGQTMADSDQTEEGAPQEAAAPKKSKKKLIMIAAAALLLVAGGGGAGWFFFTGDRQYQHTVSDNGTKLRRKMEVIHPTEFTYSRQVPKDMREGQPLVTIHVVHTPYTGAFQVQPSAGIGR